MTKMSADDFFRFVDKVYIQPELDRRRVKGKLPENFQLRECLIRIPFDQEWIVEFNDEIGWQIKGLELEPNVTIEEGKIIYLHEVIDFNEVLPPMIDEYRVPFIYMFWTGFKYQLILDTNTEGEFQFKEQIKNYIKLKLVEKTVATSKLMNSQLQKIGIWTITSLIPYPISKIVERIGSGEIEEARKILVEYCDSEFIERKLVMTWKPIDVFFNRFEVFKEALFTHRSKLHTA